jgi:hypothetical protein
MIPPTDWTGRRTVKHGFWFLLVFHQRQLGPACGSMSYIRLGFQPGSSGKWCALEKDTPARQRRNRNIHQATAIWRVVSLNWRGFAAFLQDEFDEQPRLRSRRAASADGAGSCGVGREDHHRFNERQARPLVRRACVLDRGGVHCRGSGRIPGPQHNSSGHGIVGTIFDAGRWSIERAPRYKIVIRSVFGRSSLYRTVHHHLDQFRAGSAECRLESGS